MTAKIYNDNCFNVMKHIPPKSIDMILCDLPYGVTNNPNDIPLPFPLLWQEYKRVIKDDGCIALFAQGVFYVDLVNSNRTMFRYDLVWDKLLVSGFLNANRMPLRRHEQIAIFYKNAPSFHPQMRMGKPLHSKGTAYKNQTPNNRNYGEFKITEDTRKGCTQKYPTSILTFAKPHPSKALHPTEKSVACCEWLIKSYTREGEIVLDNCMGVGTTGIACLNTKRDFIGIEINKKYFDITQARITKEFPQVSLFCD